MIIYITVQLVFSFLKNIFHTSKYNLILFERHLQGIPFIVYMLSCFSHIRFFVTPWTVAHQAPLSMGFSRQDYWNGLPCPPPGDLPNPGIIPASLMFSCIDRRVLYH